MICPRCELECGTDKFHPGKAACVAALKEQALLLRQIAYDALDLSEEGWGYAPDYFRDKWLGKQHVELRARLDAITPAPIPPLPPAPKRSE